MHESPGREPANAMEGAAGALQLAPNITAAEALAVFDRKLPGSQAEVRDVFHPFWWTVLSTRTRGMFGRWRNGSDELFRGQQMNVLVNAYSGKGFIADFEPRGVAVEQSAWRTALASSDQPGPTPTQVEVSHTARSLVRTKVLKTVKLGMGIMIDEVVPPRGILKPNWIVEGANKKFSATILVDGLDSSHYIVRVEKLAQN